jgi:hypothetical protein
LESGMMLANEFTSFDRDGCIGRDLVAVHHD